MANNQIHQEVCGLVVANQFELSLEYDRLPQFDGVVLLGTIAGRMHTLHLRNGNMKARRPCWLIT